MGVPELVALLLPGGPSFVDAVRRAWDAGDAVLPLDPSLPRRHLEDLVRTLAPGRIVDTDGTRRHDDGRPVSEGDAVVIATSGTTGDPKGVVHTHDSVRHAAFASSLGARVDPASRWLACLPLSHVAGFSVVARALVCGTDLEVHPRFDAEAADAARRAGATHVSLVPTALRRVDPTGWTTILLGGSAIPSERPPNTIATYGMTETFGGVVHDGLALNGTEVRVAAEPGESGPIDLRSPALGRCYRAADASADAEPLADEQGWFRTGDLGSVDPSTGVLRVHGRGDDLINTGGEKVWPGAVESVLATDPSVREVAVLGAPDPEWGQRVVAVVVPEAGATVELAGLRRLVREHLPVAAAPKELRLADSLPRTGLGKIRRSSLIDSGDRERGDG